MKKKLISILLLCSYLMSGIQAVNASAYTDKLRTYAQNMKELLDECENQGIPTDYEMITYRIIERFDDYLLEDEARGDTSRMAYTEKAIDELYNEAMSDLQSYLNGEKAPERVPRYQTGDIVLDGKSTIATSKINGSEVERPTFFVGYGHFNAAMQDVPNFNEFGVNSVQFELGPNRVMKSVDPWSKFACNSPEYTIIRDTDTVPKEGSASLNITYSSAKTSGQYYALYQVVDVEPGKSYTLSGYAKGENVGTVWMSANDWNDRVYIQSSSNWRKYTTNYTAPAGKTSTYIRILVESPTTSLNLDDFTFTENGTDTNLLIGGDFEYIADPWTKYESKTPEYTAESNKECVHSGNNSLKITYSSEAEANEYYTIYQDVNVTPGKRYTLKGYVKIENVNGAWISARNWDGRKYVTGTGIGNWKQVSTNYTVPEGVTSTTVRITVEDKTDALYLDNFTFTESGSNVNLLKGGDFEGFFAENSYDMYVLDKNDNNLKNAKKALEAAEKANVAVDLLLSPHYFYSEVIEKYDLHSGVNELYNVNTPIARELVEEYIRALIPEIRDYKSLKSICLANEPILYSNTMESFYLKDWQNYLKEIYSNDITKLNTAYRTQYTDFSEVDMQADISIPAKNYDYKVFNDKVLSEWFSWMTGIVKELAPDVFVHSKIMGYTSSDKWNSQMSNIGTGYMEHKDIYDVNGCDYWKYIDDNEGPLTKVMWYDYMTSLKDAPVYNTEDHVITDGSKNYSSDQAYFVAQDIYQGAIHGRANSVIWTWDFSYGEDMPLMDSIGRRPDVIAKVGEAALDLNRLAYEITSLANAVPEIGILYSNPDMLNNVPAMHAAYEAYEAAMFNGKRVKFITEANTSDINSCKIVIVPFTQYITVDMLIALGEYAENGGKIVIMGENRLSQDEHTIPHNKDDVNDILNKSTVIPYAGTDAAMTNMTSEEFCKKIRNILTEMDLYDISVIDASTGEAVHGVEYNVAEYNGRRIINLVNYSNTKDVIIYENGVPIIGGTELRSGEKIGSQITLEKYMPVTIKVKTDEDSQSVAVKNISAGDMKIFWDYNTDEDYGASIYYLGGDENLTFDSKTYALSHSCDEEGSYIVRAIQDDGSEEKGKIITVSENMPFETVLDNLKVTDNAVSCDITVRNQMTFFANGTVAVQIVDDNDNVLNYAYNKITVEPFGTRTFRISLDKESTAAGIRILTWDSKVSKNLYAETISQDF